jgi:hypothetical protein
MPQPGATIHSLVVIAPPSNQSVQNGQFLRRQIISAAMIEGSAFPHPSRTGPGRSESALHCWGWLGPFSFALWW